MMETFENAVLACLAALGIVVCVCLTIMVSLAMIAMVKCIWEEFHED